MSACGPPKCRLCGNEHWQRDGCTGKGFGQGARLSVADVARAFKVPEKLLHLGGTAKASLPKAKATKKQKPKKKTRAKKKGGKYGEGR